MNGINQDNYSRTDKTNLVFTFTEDLGVTIEKLSSTLLSDIARQLGKNGIECKKARGTGFCNKIKCIIDGTLLALSLWDFRMLWLGQKRISVFFCGNSFPRWKVWLGMVSNADYAHGEPLQKLLQAVREITDRDPRFIEKQWMTGSEFKEFIKKYPRQPL